MQSFACIMGPIIIIFKSIYISADFLIPVFLPYAGKIQSELVPSLILKLFYSYLVPVSSSCFSIPTITCNESLPPLGTLWNKTTMLNSNWMQQDD